MSARSVSSKRPITITQSLRVLDYLTALLCRPVSVNYRKSLLFHGGRQRRQQISLGVMTLCMT
jgi:hypothetical protein